MKYQLVFNLKNGNVATKPKTYTTYGNAHEAAENELKADDTIYSVDIIETRLCNTLTRN